ncbi:hypothetical protein INT43_000614 [Umbelopsis isabellina]|uniref:Uncharacterized protein n=1 Tax=Mortierella isabellina TaxID=91625 RepID=A0A8H7UGA8_MORIS|nr:hypothetical protein INT43_000614 [Umbelopsis isabellina]
MEDNSLSRYKQDLKRLEQTRDRLKREILEEKMMNSLTELVFEWDEDNMDDDGKDESERQKQLVKEILNKAYRHCVTDAILLQRMTGRTIFSLSNGYVGIRLETFYASTFASLLHILEDYVQSFVSRREQILELTKYLENTPAIKVTCDDAAKSIISIIANLGNGLIHVSLRYEDLRSEFPTKVEVKQSMRQVSNDRKNLVIEEERLVDKEEQFYYLRLTPAFISTFGEA